MNKLLDSVDVFDVYDYQSNLNKEYIASQTIMFSDGEIHYGVNSDGYIKITSITGEPTYFVYVNSDNKVALSIYKNTPESKFDDIRNCIFLIRSETGIPYTGRKAIQTAKKTIPVSSSTTTQNNNEPVDINTFKCSVCGSTPTYSEGAHGTIIAVCNKCGIEYTFEPSRYYIMTSRRTKVKNANTYKRDIHIVDASSK